MQLKYRLFRRRNGIFYWQDNESSNKEHFAQTSRREAERLLECDERIASGANLEPQSRSRLPRRARSKNGAADLASSDGRNGDAWNSDQPRTDVREDFAAKHTIRSAINRSSKRPAKICSRSFTRTETVSHIICADFTTWLSISVGSRGPSSQNEHGPKSEAKARERSLPKNMQQSSLQKKIPNAALIMNCCTKPVPRKPTQQISQQKTSTGRTAFLFIGAKSSDRSASRVA